MKPESKHFIRNYNLGWVVLYITLIYSPYLIFFDKLPGNDWSYFNALSYITNLSVFFYHTFPLHDPYICGGTDILTNPQSYIFSPLVLLNFIFGAYWGNIASLILCGFIGAITTFLLLQKFCDDEYLCLFGALIFISSNWFGLHYLEGHIAFRSMQLIPAAIYFIFHLGYHIKYQVYFSLLMAFFLLDGGIYSFNFTLFFLAVALLVGTPSIKDVIKISLQNRGIFALNVVSFLMLSSAKIIPLMLAHLDREPELHSFSYNLENLFLSLLFPFNLLKDKDVFGTKLHIHEFSCYIGYIAIFTLAFAFKKRFFPTRNSLPTQQSSLLCSDVKLLLLMLFFLWISIGFGGKYNPWSLYSAIPMLNQSHVQSRFLIFFFLFFVIILTRQLATLRRNHFIALMILIELTLVRLYSSSILLENTQPSPLMHKLANPQGHNVKETVISVSKPEVYFLKTEASKFCYDKAQFNNDSIRTITDADYRGEVYNANTGKIQNGEIIVDQFTPQKLSGSYNGKAGETFIFNTNFLLGWRGSNNTNYETKRINNLLAVEFKRSPTIFILRYRPPYFEPLLATFLLSLALYTITLKLAKNEQ